MGEPQQIIDVMVLPEKHSSLMRGNLNLSHHVIEKVILSLNWSKKNNVGYFDG